ncbi:MAG: energy transducer TonB [Pseudomonadota bacterium]
MSEESIEHDAASGIAKKSMDTPLLLGALVLVSGMLAWFFFGTDNEVPEDIPLLIEPVVEAAEPVRAVVAEQTPSDELLARARFAAEAGTLVQPAGSNALYYYVQYMEQNPDNAEAQTELQQVAERIGSLIAQAVANDDWVGAASVVGQLNNAGVETAATQAFEQQLQAFRDDRQSAALSAAESGNESTANDIIDVIAQLPRTQPGDVLQLRSQVRDALVAKRLSDQAAAQRAAERAAARRAAAATRPAATAPRTNTAAPAAAPVAAADPLLPLRTAVSAGDWDAALAVYNGLQSGSDSATEARGELVSAMSSSVRDAAAGGDTDSAELLRTKLVDVDPDAAAGLESVVSQALILEATAETVSAATLRRTRAVAPNYPRNALRRNLTGRVKVEFNVGLDGVPTEIEVVETTSAVFNRSAVQAVSEWRYEPREIRGQSVVQRVYAYLEYTLE